MQSLPPRSAEPPYIDTLLMRARKLQRDGDFAEAQAAYRKVVKKRPSHFDAWHLLGVCELLARNYVAATRSLKRAVLLDPQSVAAYSDLGVALKALQQCDEALACFDRVVELNPGFTNGHYNRGSLLFAMKRFDEALVSLDHAVAIDPRHAKALINRANALLALRRFDEALAGFDKAIAIEPRHADAFSDRGRALHELGRFTDAIESYNRALALNPDHVPALFNRGAAFKGSMQADRAIADFDRALALAPDHCAAWINRGEVLSSLERHREALASFQHALSINPELAEAWLGCAMALMSARAIKEALAAGRRALDIKPDSVRAFNLLGICHAQQGMAEAAVSFFDRSLAIEPEDEIALSGKIFFMDFIANGDFISHQAARAAWWDRIGAKLPKRQPLQRHIDTNPNKRIVLGYVSADFKNHSAAYVFQPVLRNHDRSRFEVICYSSSRTEDEVTGSFRELADRWRDVQLWADDQLIECIRSDQVDILIDLSGHSEGHRLRVFASKPAPIQVTAWGHATGTGLPTIDYVFSDPVLVPPDVRHLFAEQIYDLPCAMIVEPPPADSRSSEPPVTSNGYLTYGVFNRISKISDAAIAVWARILRSDLTARLTVKHYDIDIDSVRAMLIAKFATHGIARDRLQLLGTTSREDHLAAYAQIDICLDPFPQGGGVSTWEALHMGVPIVTQLGNAIPKRVGGAILSAIGLTDWVASNDDEYVDIALRSTPEQLRTLRRALPDMINMDCGPAAYTKAVDESYRAMWSKYCDENNGLRSVKRCPEFATAEEKRWLPPTTTSRNVDVTSLCARAQTLHRQGRLAEALAAYRNILEQYPNHLEAVYMLGVCERQSGGFEAAARLLRCALLLDPSCAPAHFELGLALGAVQRHEEALACFDRLIDLKPDFIEAHYNRGNVLLATGRLNEAIASFDNMAQLDPNHLGTWNNRGNALLRLHKLEQAIASYDQALALNPTHLSALLNRGSALLQQGDVEAAVSWFDRALAIKPEDDVALSNRIFALDLVADYDFASHQAERSEWWDRIGVKIAAQAPLQYDNDINPNKRIVLGYVSGDFNQHSAGFCFRPVLRNHDRLQFEVICYSTSELEDQVTASFRQLADRWRDVQQWSDDQMVECIRADQVDILIDLSGHTKGNRLRAFAGKPAPIQVTAWGHATGTGLKTMDYLFSDPVMVPLELRHLFAEQIYDLPCAIIVEPPPADSRSSEPPVTSNGHLTYGVFNRISKISDAAVSVWARILRSDVTARILIKGHALNDAATRGALLDKFAYQGIAPDRLRLIGATSREDHLAAYRQVDICLDPFPQGGGISTWEALYMGVPVVAKIGNAIPKRLGGAILSAIGLTDWIACDDDEYVEIALRSTPERLRTLRHELPEMIATRCGPGPYTDAVEKGYRTMWHKFCEADQGDRAREQLRRLS